MNSSDFDYVLPKQCIAQESVYPRDHSRLMILDRATRNITDTRFFDIDKWLRPGDLLVCNSTKVFRSRLFGWFSKQSAQEGKKQSFELFVLRERSDVSLNKKKEQSSFFEALIKPLRKINIGDKIYLGCVKLYTQKRDVFADVVSIFSDGIAEVRFNISVECVFELCEKIGHIPVPPYIKKEPENNQSYQTVYAKEVGSVAAPTAGFHFTDELIEKLKKQGICFADVILHVGIGTFRPMKTETIEEHIMHSEYVELTNDVILAINETKSKGGRVIAVGTTTVRVIEGVYALNGKLVAYQGDVQTFITPGFKFNVIDALITNFHLPKSTLLVLVSAFADREFILKAYDSAIKNNYRFFSFGDAMLIL